MNRATKQLLSTLKRAEGFSELVNLVVLPNAVRALRILVEEEVEEKSLPASCAHTLGEDSGVDWDTLTREIIAHP